MKRHLSRIAFVIILLFVGYTGYVFWVADSFEDPICDLAKGTFQLNCTVLASTTVYDSGSILPIQSEGSESDRVGLPSLQVLGETCFLSVDGAPLSLIEKKPSKSVVFGTREYSVNKSAGVNAELTLPKSIGFKLVGGPKISEVRSITLSADAANLFDIDNVRFQDQIDQCKIRQSCLDNLTKEQEIVSQILVAKNLVYKLKDKNNSEFSLSAATKEGLISIESSAKLGKGSKVDLSNPYDTVFAINSTPVSEFNLFACNEPLKIMKVEGQAMISVKTRDETKEQISKGDAEASAVVRAKLSDSERNPGESYAHGEAYASAKWSFNEKSQTLEFIASSVAIAGTRWPFDQEKLAKVFAVSEANSNVMVRLYVANRSNKKGTLFANVKLENKSNKYVNPYQFFETFQVTRKNGNKEHISAIWNSGDNNKKFRVTDLEAGEIIDIKIDRNNQNIAFKDRHSGAIEDYIEIKFELN